MTPRRKALIAGSLATLVLGTLAVFKPIRIFAPGLFGLSCPTQTLCLDAPDRMAEATALQSHAIVEVEGRLGPLDAPPRLLFCSTQACFRTFGNPRVSALYFWGAKTAVINDIGWQPHIVTHEMIHHWQAETFGAIKGRSLPQWYIEGMAYVLSDDPRSVIPHPIPQAQRAQFRDWRAAGHDWRTPPKE